MQRKASFKKTVLFIGCLMIFYFVNAQHQGKFDPVKSQKAISFALNYIRLVNEKNIDSVILLSDIQFKRVTKVESKPAETRIIKTLDELRSSLKADFESTIPHTPLTIDTAFVNHVNNGGKNKIRSDEIYFVIIVSKYFSKESNIEKILKNQLVVRMGNTPKVIALLEE